jgi:hypothetical protein
VAVGLATMVLVVAGLVGLAPPAQADHSNGLDHWATGAPPLSPLTAVSSAEPSVVTPPTLSVCEVFELNRVDLIVALMESRRAPA